MRLYRFFKYRYITKKRQRYASLAVSIALAHASFGQVKYKSLGNGMADITLALEEDKNFRLEFQPITESHDKALSLRGKWHAEEDKYVLRFKRKRRNLKSLFVSNSGFEKLSQVQDKRTVVIPKRGYGVVINGIYCEKRLS